MNNFELIHIIPAKNVDAEERQLAAVLSSSGYDVAKLSLNGLAQQALAERAKSSVLALGIPPLWWPHFLRSDGSVEVRFQFSRKTDHGVAKMTLV